MEFATTASMTYPSTGGTYFSVLDPSATDLNGATNGINALSFPPTNLTNWGGGHLQDVQGVERRPVRPPARARRVRDRRRSQRDHESAGTGTTTGIRARRGV
ncbi:MAG: hypothetical protein R2705_06640 [Ilumatobacteraceae bacterium]